MNSITFYTCVTFLIHQSPIIAIKQPLARDFNATNLSTYAFSNLYTSLLPHNLMKDKLIDLIEKSFQREGSTYLACNNKSASLNIACTSTTAESRAKNWYQ